MNEILDDSIIQIIDEEVGLVDRVGRQRIGSLRKKENCANHVKQFFTPNNNCSYRMKRGHNKCRPLEIECMVQLRSRYVTTLNIIISLSSCKKKK